ncbi:hypothetical protein [Brevundimonas sp. NIBR11]|uniref:hypothetical protein n=1 Tax=Brevundimonas sp. NIBR11 TaxID=3015999 RepID=UPI0022EFE335|nr:hypothetical protein [Brevundimonas sp. NIBR11]
MAPIALTVMLAACGSGAGDPKATPITPELLEDGAQVQRIANRLEPTDRAAFTRYVAGRAMGNAMGIPPLVNEAGKDPSTVAEAIELINRADANIAEVNRLQLEMEAKRAPLSAERESLLAAAEAAGWAPGPTQAANAKGDEINRLQDEYQQRIAALQRH